MAKQKRQKKTSIAEYIEKISSRIFDRVKEELEKSFRMTPSGNIKKIKKILPGLKKQVQKKIKEELKRSFRVMPVGKAKKGKSKK
ncbi:MAG: hypothetical protein ABSE89_09025 [Sedimentisphaerales bacterium]